MCTPFVWKYYKRIPPLGARGFLLPRRQMETSLFLLVLHIATALFTHVSKYLAKNPFEGVVSDLTALWALWILNGLVSVIADVNGSAVEMA